MGNGHIPPSGPSFSPPYPLIGLFNFFTIPPPVDGGTIFKKFHGIFNNLNKNSMEIVSGWLYNLQKFPWDSCQLLHGKLILLTKWNKFHGISKVTEIENAGNQSSHNLFALIPCICKQKKLQEFHEKVLWKLTVDFHSNF